MAIDASIVTPFEPTRHNRHLLRARKVLLITDLPGTSLLCGGKRSWKLLAVALERKRKWEVIVERCAIQMGLVCPWGWSLSPKLIYCVCEGSEWDEIEVTSLVVLLVTARNLQILTFLSYRMIMYIMFSVCKTSDTSVSLFLGLFNPMQMLPLVCPM